MAETGKDIHVAFCPERVAEGKAMKELSELPQIVSGFDEQAVDDGQRALRPDRPIDHPPDAARGGADEALHQRLALHPVRHRQPVLHDRRREYGVDFYRVYDAMTHDYPRMAGLPKAGFAAGPCLFKDTMQLAAFNNNNFFLGHAAMLINEGLPNFVVRHAQARTTLWRR